MEAYYRVYYDNSINKHSGAWERLSKQSHALIMRQSASKYFVLSLPIKSNVWLYNKSIHHNQEAKTYSISTNDNIID